MVDRAEVEAAAARLESFFGGTVNREILEANLRHEEQHKAEEKEAEAMSKIEEAIKVVRRAVERFAPSDVIVPVHGTAKAMRADHLRLVVDQIEYLQGQQLSVEKVQGACKSLREQLEQVNLRADKMATQLGEERAEKSRLEMATGTLTRDRDDARLEVNKYTAQIEGLRAMLKAEQDARQKAEAQVLYLDERLATRVKEVEDLRTQLNHWRAKLENEQAAPKPEPWSPCTRPEAQGYYLRGHVVRRKDWDAETDLHQTAGVRSSGGYSPSLTATGLFQLFGPEDRPSDVWFYR